MTIKSIEVKSFNAVIIINGVETKITDKEGLKKLILFNHGFQKNRKDEHVQALQSGILMLSTAEKGLEWVDALREKQFICTQYIDEQLTGEKRKTQWEVKTPTGVFNKEWKELLEAMISQLGLKLDLWFTDWNEEGTAEVKTSAIVRKYKTN